MDPFVDVFLKIDTKNSNQITVDELKAYATKNRIDNEAVRKWIKEFDSDNRGVITVDKLCSVLRIKPANIMSRRQSLGQQNVGNPHLGDDIHVIYEDMPLADQLIISNETRERFRTVKSKDDMNKLTEDLKEFCDNRFGKSWQVGVIDGAHWITHNHLPGCAFQFHMNDHTYMFWRINE
ncbi:hypothetical protein EG68_04215 [Paragonimus skrjabini miyazakii]|uniref:EF-hand domain-containing protein n=1 Tax=Paragonimus skrjabini miyazakii TaxID=59628 RepID=A0A8S9Z544_9TREM|nr:hypothetical protein EG68_04215 [Paragonimus skrjabini miyazakii]